MKFADLKVGMEIKATTNKYSCTCKNNSWKGIITSINKRDFSFKARTTSTTNPDIKIGEVFGILRAENFEPCSKVEKTITTMNEIPLKVTYAHNTVYVIYNGKIVAKATCRKDDNFNEEFGLNLALRRFCETLCNENTTKKVVYNTDRVEDFI